MAQITATEACAAIREIWRLTALKALFEKMVVRNRVLSVTEDISAMGDILHLKINPTPTVGDITAATGAYTAEAVTITNVDLTVNKWKYVAHDVVDIAEIQSDLDLVNNFAEAFVPALGNQIEQDLLALYSSATTNPVIGDVAAGDAFGDGTILDATLALDNLKIDNENRSFILPPASIMQMRKDPKFTNANILGIPKAVQTTGFQTDLYGTPVYKTTNVATVSGSGASAVRAGLLLHRDGLMVGIQKNIKMEKFARTQFSTPFASSVLYGVAIARNNHNQVLYLKNKIV